jgi:thiol-disulfide isomerase/thioredoxin
MHTGKVPSRSEAIAYEPEEPRPRGRLLRGVGLVLAVAALAAVTVWPRLFPPGGELLRKPAPDLVMPLVANGERGARLQLSDLRGKVVLLDFWASWCGPCATQSAILERVAQAHPADVVVVGINLDDEPEVAQRYAAGKGLSYPIVTDQQGDAQRAYGVTNLPSLVLVDARGNVVRYLQGLVSQSELERAIRDASREPG